jgi:hypothetical protein
MRSMERYDQNELLIILENAEMMTVNKTHRMVVHAFTYIALILLCQGG